MCATRCQANTQAITKSKRQPCASPYLLHTVAAPSCAHRPSPLPLPRGGSAATQPGLYAGLCPCTASVCSQRAAAALAAETAAGRQSPNSNSRSSTSTRQQRPAEAGCPQQQWWIKQAVVEAADFCGAGAFELKRPGSGYVGRPHVCSAPHTHRGEFECTVLCRLLCAVWCVLCHLFDQASQILVLRVIQGLAYHMKVSSCQPLAPMYVLTPHSTLPQIPFAALSLVNCLRA